VVANAGLAETLSERVRHDLQTQGFSVCRQLLPATAVAGATRKLEAAVDRHLAAAVASGEIATACEGLPIESRIVQAYAACPERAPASWVNQVKGTVAFQHHLFRDEALCALIEALTGRPAVVASRFNCRCKLRDSASANFPWHQDHAFFRMQYLLKKQEPLRLLAAWAPFVPVDDANGAVELCPVSSGTRPPPRSGPRPDTKPSPPHRSGVACARLRAAWPEWQLPRRAPAAAAARAAGRCGAAAAAWGRAALHRPHTSPQRRKHHAARALVGRLGLRAAGLRRHLPTD